MKGFLVLLLATSMTGLMACEAPQESSDAADDGTTMHEEASDADAMESHDGDGMDENADDDMEHAGDDDMSNSDDAFDTALQQAMALGLIIDDEKVGDGAVAMNGQKVVVHYTGWLFDDSKPANKGDKFDSSHDRGDPFPFQLGAGNVIKGWDLGVVGMKVGGERNLTIPSQLGYGERGTHGGPIPGNATLIFHVELLDVISEM